MESRQRSLLVTLAMLALVFAAGWQLLSIETDNDLVSWTSPEAPSRLTYERFLETFGSDEFILAAYKGQDVFGIEALDASLDVLDRLEAVEGVVRVFGPATLYRDVFGGEDPEALLDELSSTDFYRGLVVSEDLETAGLYIAVDPPSDSRRRRQLVDEVQAALAPLEELGFETHCVGPPTMTAQLDATSLTEASRSLPIAALASVFFLAVLLRSIRGTLIALVCSLATIILTLSIPAAIGRPLDMFTSALPALLWVLSLAAILHVLVRYRRQLHDHEHAEALRRAVSGARFPCGLSSATTAAGFFSLNAAPLEPVRGLGTLAGVGILISFFVSFVLGPALIDVLRPRTTSRERRAERLSELAAYSFDHPLRITLPFIVITLGGLLCLAVLKPSSNPLTFFPKSAGILEDYRFVADNLSGMSAIELRLETPDGWNRPETWSRIEAVADRLGAHPRVAKVRTPTDLLKKLSQWNADLEADEYRLPASAADSVRLLEEADPVLASEIGTLVAADGRSVRLSVLVTAMESETFSEIEALAREAVIDEFETQAEVTGIVSLLVGAQRRLLGSQIQSMALAAITIFVFIWAGLRSLRWAALAMIPNLVPVAAVLLMMAAFGLPLDPGTLMVAGVALGIAVDDTVHVVTSVRRRMGDHPCREAIVSAVSDVGTALSVTTAAAAVGFLSLTPAEFLPIRYFGLLTAAAMIVALFGDLAFLPSLIRLREQIRPTEETTQP